MCIEDLEKELAEKIKGIDINPENSTRIKSLDLAVAMYRNENADMGRINEDNEKQFLNFANKIYIYIKDGTLPTDDEEFKE